MRERLVEKFAGRAENGRKYTVLIYQEMIDASSMDGPGSIPGMQSCRLSNGEPVNCIDNDTYRTLMGEVLKRC